jgi:hypothetical protein
MLVTGCVTMTWGRGKGEGGEVAAPLPLWELAAVSVRMCNYDVAVLPLWELVAVSVRMRNYD